jgi:FAD:protein FMN transferase
MKTLLSLFKGFFFLLMLLGFVWAGGKIAPPAIAADKIGHISQKSADASDPSFFPVENIKLNWWESSGQIYFKIPARILFKLEEAPEGAAENISRQAWAEFERIGKIFNPFAPTSEVAALNDLKKTGRVKISKDIFDVLKISSDIWTASNGCFDPTLMRIKTLWKNAEKNQQIPSDKQILSELQASGFAKVHISNEPDSAIQVDHPDIMFDFGGIVKGYAVDRVREILINNGVIACLVQLGGEVSTFGGNDGVSWRIGIQHPREMSKIWGVVSIPGPLNISTSGNYMQPIMIQGRSFYHIFNPKTGKPVSEKILGVTTISRDGKISSAILDGSATAITVLGSIAGLEFAKKTGIDALILFEKKGGGIGEISTPGFIYEKSSD